MGLERRRSTSRSRSGGPGAEVAIRNGFSISQLGLLTLCQLTLSWLPNVHFCLWRRPVPQLGRSPITHTTILGCGGTGATRSNYPVRKLLCTQPKQVAKQNANKNRDRVINGRRHPRFRTTSAVHVSQWQPPNGAGYLLLLCPSCHDNRSNKKKN